MKKLFLILTLIATISFSGCLKDSPNVDFSNVGTVVELPYSGQANFSSDALNFISDTITLTFTVNIASPYPPDHNIEVTVSADPSLVATYNSQYGTPYEKFPADAYSFPDQTVTIEAGTRLDTFSITFYKTTLDPAVSYLLPVTIKDASGETISGNLSTHYFHFIGNPLAGSYLQSFYRWNDVPDTTGPPNSTVFEDEPVTIIPVSATTIFLPEGYLDANALGGVSLSFTNNGGVISDPNLFIDATTQSNIDAGGFKVVTPPTMISYQIVGDASTHYSGTTFRFYFEILNSSGGNRKTINVFTKQ